MTNFNEADHPRISDGTFTNKPQSAPEITLDVEVAQALASTPEEAQSVEYSSMLLSSHLGQELNLVAEKDGGAVFEYDARGLGRPTQRVRLDSRGNVAKVEYLVNLASGDTWYEHEQVSSDVQDLQEVIDRGRLQAAGVTLMGAADNDGGAYGLRDIGARAKDVPSDVGEIAKLVRADIKRAIEFGALPATNTPPRVTIERFAGGQAINISLYDQPDSLTRIPDLSNPGYTRPSPYQRRLNNTLEAILRQYNDSEVESQTDYFNLRFHSQVKIVDEHTQRWEEQQRAERARKRAGG